MKWTTVALVAGLAVGSMPALAGDALDNLQGGINMGVHGTRAQAKALVEKAIREMDRVGTKKAFAEFNDVHDTKFHYGDLYIFVNSLDGYNLVHGVNPRVVGLKIINQRDPDGHWFVKERFALVKAKGEGWNNFKYYDPVSHRVEQKHAWVVLHDGVVVGCGAYDALPTAHY